MTLLIDDNLKKSIKKNIYGKAQVAKIIFPPGLGAVALDEAKAILSNLWFAQPFTGKVYLLKNEIQVRPVYLFAIVELLLRNQCFSDVRLVIFKDIVIGKKAFEKKCREIDWNYYVNKKMSLKIKVNSVSSKAFHETGLKEILTEIIKPYVSDVVSGEHSNETTCLYVEFYKDKLTISISLAGQPLYKRGYRGKLSASAPLREDVAACCIQNALLFSKKYHQDFLPKTMLIPFSGTGTFAFEFCQLYFQFLPALFGRDYALKKMPLFKKTNFDFLVNQAKEHFLSLKSKRDEQAIHLYCIDKSGNAMNVLEENLLYYKKAAAKRGFVIPEIVSIQSDFLTLNVDAFSGNIFMPLNPPYGIRLNKESNSVLLYKKIALKINEISMKAKENQYNVLGFVLCPDQETWSVLMRNLTQSKTETYHFTQGGLDIRVCQFFI